MSQPTSVKIREQQELAGEACMEGSSQWPGMTFEEGVDQALRWVLGDEPSPPMEDE